MNEKQLNCLKRKCAFQEVSGKGHKIAKIDPENYYTSSGTEHLHINQPFEKKPDFQMKY